MRSATPAAFADLSNRLLRASGADGKSASAATRAMLHASVHGVDSHGIRLLPFYGDSLTTGLVKGSPDIKITALRPATAVLDADGGLGHVAAYGAMAEACRLARINGISSVWLEAAVPEAQAGMATPGQPVAARFSAYPGETFSGKVGDDRSFAVDFEAAVGAPLHIWVKDHNNQVTDLGMTNYTPKCVKGGPCGVAELMKQSAA